MAYVKLDLPEALEESVRSVIHFGVEPLLQDVHWMLATTIAHPSDDGPGRQLQMPIALTLLAVVAGVSTELYSRSGGTGDRFKNCLTTFFPWDVDPPSGASKEEAAKILYDVFRNPLIHKLGLNRATGPVVKIGQVFRGTSDAEQRVVELEGRSDKPFSKPCLVVTPEKRVLWLDPFYWGVRKLVERWSRDASETSHAHERFTRTSKQ